MAKRAPSRARATKGKAPHPDELPVLYPLADPHPDDSALMIPEAALRDPYGDGARAAELAELLPMTEGATAGQLFGDVMTEWQRNVILALHGHRDCNRQRIIRWMLLLTSRKSGKTSFAAVLTALECLLTTEGRAQIVGLASSRDQARIMYRHVAELILADKTLSKRFKISDYTHRIVDQVTGAEIKALASESGNSLVGLNPSVLVADELHAIGALLGERGVDIVHSIESGMVAREQSLRIYITTAPLKVEAGIYKEVTNHARKVFRGEVDDRRALILPYEIPEHLDFKDPKHWHYSNPSLGQTISLAALQERHETAKVRGADALAEFYSQNLNVAPRLRAETVRSDGFDMRAWDSCADESFSVDRMAAEATHIVAAIDAGGLRDLTALVLLGCMPDGRYGVAAHFFITQSGYERLRNTTPAADFVAAGELTVVEEVGEDLAMAFDAITELSELGKLGAVAGDPWGLAELADKALELTGRQLIGVPQGVRLTPHINALERAIGSRQFVHDGNSCLRWCMENVRIKETGQAVALVKPDERDDAVTKIDGAVALTMAYAVRAEGVFDVSAMVAFV